MFFADLLRLTGRLTPRRILNLGLIYAGLWLSKLSGKVRVFGRPFAVSAEVASVCNLRCPECMVGQGKTNRSNKQMDPTLFNEILKHHRKHSFYTNLYFQGEPFLNPALPQLISKASGLGYYTSVSTNGHFLTDDHCRAVVSAGLDRLIISLDGLDQDTYAFYRVGGNWQKVVDGIAVMSRVRNEMNARKPLIVAQFLVNRKNEGQIPELLAFSRKQGADVVELKTMQVYEESGAEKFLPENQRFNRYKNSGKPHGFRTKGRNSPCFRLWSHAVYTSDGLLVPCCYDKVPQHPMGNIKGGDPWSSPSMNAFREKVMRQRKEIGICSNCGQ
ncbi:MAG: radical SAM protein [Bacteroides sp.]|jgi:MoaA/NifB/PqqE/SkfB family radical SAM enzyme|nr:radical SAM protein [Bacteroides sp.]